MNERFAELLEKSRHGQLTAAETEEFVRLLNAPILDPIETPPRGFVSNRVFGSSDLTRRLRAIDWFAHVGEPLSLDLTMPVQRVGNWAQAMESCMEDNWENATLEAQNQLTGWLHEHDRKNYQNWNTLVDEHKRATLNPLAEEKWVPYQQKHGLDIAVVHSAQWDILGALMENSYLNSKHRCFFFLELLLVYESGHFPCGWRGEWPAGSLVVY